MKTEAPTIETDVLLELMFRLVQAYLACGEQTAQVELILRRIASAYGMRKSRVVAFPTAGHCMTCPLIRDAVDFLEERNSPVQEASAREGRKA